MDTIVAQATAQGQAGVGIIRLSGPAALTIAQAITQSSFKPRYAHFRSFYDAHGQVLDQGIGIFFPAPHSFTGEDVVELQGHGGTVIMDLLIQRSVSLGARLARAGEFSERAFLNDKIDLTQAEAIADLINSTSEQAARNALHSMQGVFSQKVHALVEQLIALRVYIEAAIDFPEEEINFLAGAQVEQDLQALLESLDTLLQQSRQGSVLQNGLQVVIAGRPNAGKSSLLNALCGKSVAIVTNTAGTTRDVLKEPILLDGILVHISDTAGLCQTDDEVESIGIDRARAQIQQADRVLWVLDDSTESEVNIPYILAELGPDIPIKKLTLVRNKIDKTAISAQQYRTDEGIAVVCLSAQKEMGMEVLVEHLKQCAGLNRHNEGGFSARTRHILALEQAKQSLLQGHQQLINSQSGELLAEDLRLAQQILGEITGVFCSDDLLGKIFSSFCIGK